MSCSGRTGNKATLSTLPTLSPDVATWEIVSLSGPGWELGFLDISNLDTDEFEQVVCNDLAALNEIEILLNFPPNSVQALPDKGTSTLWTITFPLMPGFDNPAKLAFSGFITAFTISTIANNENMQAPVTVKPDGDPGDTHGIKFAWTAAETTP